MERKRKIDVSRHDRHRLLKSFENLKSILINKMEVTNFEEELEEAIRLSLESEVLNSLIFNDEMKMAEEISRKEQTLTFDQQMALAAKLSCDEEDYELKLALERSCHPQEQQDEELKQLLLAIQNSKKEMFFLFDDENNSEQLSYNDSSFQRDRHPGDVKSLGELESELTSEQRQRNSFMEEGAMKIVQLQSQQMASNQSKQKHKNPQKQTGKNKKSNKSKDANDDCQPWVTVNSKRSKSKSVSSDHSPKQIKKSNVPLQPESDKGLQLLPESGKCLQLLPESGKGLRPIIVDGCNIAFQHGKNLRYSAKGLLIVFNYFSKKFGYTSKNFTIVNKPGPGQRIPENHDILDYLYKSDVLVYTPRRNVGNKLIVSDDDLFMLNLAKEKSGIVISLDQFRDAYERTNDDNLKDVIENRLLQFVFKGDEIIFPDDPMGPGGPNLEQFIRF